jgi:hypothetical protein
MLSYVRCVSTLSTLVGSCLPFTFQKCIGIRPSMETCLISQLRVEALRVDYRACAFALRSSQPNHQVSCKGIACLKWNLTVPRLSGYAAGRSVCMCSYYTDTVYSWDKKAQHSLSRCLNTGALPFSYLKCLVDGR